MPFTFKPCPISGLVEIEPKIFGDSRGYFLETYSEKDFFAAGYTMKFVQDNQSKSSKGVFRGLHFQKKHPQGKLVRCLDGLVYDVAVDLRNVSPTFGQFHGVYLDSEKQNMFYVPPGFAHGFMVLSDTAVFTYKCTDFYHPEDEGSILWNDPMVNIPWNSIAAGIIPQLSEKDTNSPAFNKDQQYFSLDGVWEGSL
jgi:dTDP-4-dehydrorhamnose 3,5-epimerase